VTEGTRTWMGSASPHPRLIAQSSCGMSQQEISLRARLLVTCVWSTLFPSHRTGNALPRSHMMRRSFRLQVASSVGCCTSLSRFILSSRVMGHYWHTRCLDGRGRGGLVYWTYWRVDHIRVRGIRWVVYCLGLRRWRVGCHNRRGSEPITNN
jgi:hypothetical protein